MAGSAIYKEAVARGHHTVAVVRDEAKARQLLGPGANILAKDVFDFTKEDLSAYDVIVKAVSTPPDKAYKHVDLTAKFVSFLREQDAPRFLTILGAGSLLDANDVPMLDTMKTQPEVQPWIGIPIGQYRELLFLREIDNVNWVGVSPSFNFIPGEAHTPVLGKDHLLTAADGSSHTTSGTMAVAILNELEQPSVFKSRFTVSD